MTQLQFMSKYHIGSEKYNMYFRGVSKVIKMRVSKRMDERVEYLKQRHEQIKKNAQARQYDDRTEYYLTIEDIAKRNHVTIDIVKKASEEYTLSELKTAKFVN
jgi:hypothetical protein